MKRKSLQKSLIGIASAAVMGVMSRGARQQKKSQIGTSDRHHPLHPLQFLHDYS
jgi:hypothetical protein